MDALTKIVKVVMTYRPTRDIKVKPARHKPASPQVAPKQ